MPRKKIKPAKQGDFDALCGFYAIANSLTFLFPDMDKADIFTTMFDYYIEEFETAYDVLYGIYRMKLNKILNHVVHHFDIPCKVYRPFWSKKAEDIHEFLNTVRGIQNRQDSVFIIGYEHGIEGAKNYFSHWTVIKKITGKSLLTFDSDNEKSRISLDRCRLWSENYSEEKPYRLSSTDTFIILKVDE
jgi:hypothetical protein